MSIIGMMKLSGQPSSLLLSYNNLKEQLEVFEKNVRTSARNLFITYSGHSFVAADFKVGGGARVNGHGLE